jgi:RelA/SpoT family (p)ppGpp synthetase
MNELFKWIKTIKTEDVYTQRTLFLLQSLQDTELKLSKPFQEQLFFEIAYKVLVLIHSYNASTKLMFLSLIYCLHAYSDYDIQTFLKKENITSDREINLLMNLKKIKFSTDINFKLKAEDIGYTKTLLLAISENIDTAILFLAIHTIKIEFMDNLEPNEQKNIATLSETIFAPLAHQCGYGAIKNNLEDQALKYLKPNDYIIINKHLESYKKLNKTIIRNVITKIMQLLQNTGIKDHNIEGRIKHIYSIYQKMIRKECPLEEIFDIIAIRIILNNIDECYQCLGLIHELWNPINEELDDYIVNSKSNGYQSLHTVIRLPNRPIRIEIQIRTNTMHQQAEYGYSAHATYKDNQNNLLQRNKNIISIVEEIESPQLKTQESIYVLSPKGNIKVLDKNCTPIDFAYAIHTQIGHQCRGAKVNSKMVPLNHKLETGDVVDIITQNNAHPSQDWLSKPDYVHSKQARKKIFNWLKLSHDNPAKEGQILFEKEIKKNKMKNYKIQDLVQKFNCATNNDFYTAIFEGRISFSAIFSAIKQLDTPCEKPNISSSTAHKQENFTPIAIEEVNNILIRMAKCCNPISGEPISAYTTVNRGISIHRTDCINISNFIKENPKRILQATWNSNSNKQILTSLHLNLKSTKYINELKKDLHNANITYNQFNISKRNYNIQATLCVEMKNQEKLNELINQLKLTSYIDKVVITKG